MRTLPLPSDYEEDQTIGIADGADNPQFMLELVDGLLARHGLEIVQYEAPAGEYIFSIEEREEQDGEA